MQSMSVFSSRNTVIAQASSTPRVQYLDSSGTSSGGVGGGQGGEVPAVQYGSGSASGMGIDAPVGATSAQPVGDMAALQTIYTPENLSLIDLVQMFVVYAFIIAGALSAFFIFFGGISFILSGGNDEKIRAAVNTIRYSIIGLIVTILSFTFVTILGRIFGLNFLDYLSFGEIKESINRLIQTGEKPVDNFEVVR